MSRQTPSLRTEQALCQVPWNPQASGADAGFPEGTNRGSGPGAREDPGFRGRNLLNPRRGLFWEILEVFSGTPGGCTPASAAARARAPTSGEHSLHLLLSSLSLAFKIILTGCLLRMDSEDIVTVNQTQSLSSGSYRPAGKVDIIQGDKPIKTYQLC